MKKSGVLLSILLLTISVSQFVSAIDASSIEAASKEAVSWISGALSPFFQFLLGDNTAGEYFYARVLLLIIIYALILTILKRVNFFDKNYAICVIISAAVSILGTRFISKTSLIEWILTPYGALAIAIAVFLPFLIYFLFVHTSVAGSLGRRLAWILYGAIFVALAIQRWDPKLEFNWIYIIGAVAVLICFLFDREVHKYFGLYELSVWKKQSNDAEIAKLQADRAKIAGVDSPEAKRALQNIDDRLKKLKASSA